MQSQFAPNLTSQDLNHVGLGSVAGRGGVRVSFFYRRIKIATANPAKDGTEETRLYARKMPVGDPSTIAIEHVTPEVAAQRWPQEWALFQEYGEDPLTGTPLSDLPGMSRAQVAQLMAVSINSVEDLLAVPDDMIGQYGMDARRARKLAIAWAAKKNDNADMIDTAETLSRMEAQVQAMQKQMAQMQEANAALAAQNEALRSIGGVHSGPMVAAANKTAGADAPYDIDDNDGFMGGGSPVTGNDDLGDDLPDPLKD